MGTLSTRWGFLALYIASFFCVISRGQKGNPALRTKWLRGNTRFSAEEKAEIYKQFVELDRRVNQFRAAWDSNHSAPFNDEVTWSRIPPEQSVAICVSSKDDNVFIREWAEYYIRVMGVNRIYLYDDGSSVPLNLTILDWIQRGVIRYHFVKAERRPTQRHCFHHCFESYARLHRHLVIFDTDEFLFIRDMKPSDPYPLATYLARFPNYGAVEFQWIIVGHDNRLTRPLHLTTPEAYLGCGVYKLDRAKSVCNTKYATRTGQLVGDQSNIHKCCVNPKLKSKGMKAEFVNVGFGFSQRQRQSLSRMQVEHALNSSAFLMHYVVKSKEDFELKSVRGGGSGRVSWRSDSYWDEISQMIARQGNFKCFHTRDIVWRFGFRTSQLGQPPECLVGRPPITYGRVPCVPLPPRSTAPAEVAPPVVTPKPAPQPAPKTQLTPQPTPQSTPQSVPIPQPQPTPQPASAPQPQPSPTLSQPLTNPAPNITAEAHTPLTPQPQVDPQPQPQPAPIQQEPASNSSAIPTAPPGPASIPHSAASPGVFPETAASNGTGPDNPLNLSV